MCKSGTVDIRAEDVKVVVEVAATTILVELSVITVDKTVPSYSLVDLGQ